MPQVPARKDVIREIPIGMSSEPIPLASTQAKPQKLVPLPQPLPPEQMRKLLQVAPPLTSSSSSSSSCPSSTKQPELVLELPQSEMTVEQLVKEVGGRYDTLNKLWTQAEDSLRKFLVPHRVEHCFRSYIDDENHNHQQYGIHTCECLTWAKNGNSWRLCYEIYTDDDPDRGYVKPITECSVDIRQNLVKHFAELREKVIEAARKNVSNLEKAIADFASLLK